MANDEIRETVTDEFYHAHDHQAAINRARDHFNNRAWRFLSEEFLTSVVREFGLATSLRWVHEAPYFAHVSALDDTKIAYFPTTKHMQECRPVSVRAGKFFRRCFDENVKDSVIAQITNMYIASVSEIEVLFAETADEIEEVYVHGPRSCMGGKDDDDWCVSSIHPSRVYATPDIMLAYIKNSRGSISARALINKNNKEYSVAYGNSDTLITELRKQGYRSGTLNGCRINHIRDNGAIVMPYVDQCEAIDDDGSSNYFYICEDMYDAVNSIGSPDKTHGLLHDVDKCSTGGCDNWVNVDDSNNYVIHQGVACNDCIRASEYVTVSGRGTPCGLATKDNAIYLQYLDSYVYKTDYEDNASTFLIDGNFYKRSDIFKLGMYPCVSDDEFADDDWKTIKIDPQAVKSPNGDWYTYHLEGSVPTASRDDMAAQYLWQKKDSIHKRFFKKSESGYFLISHSYSFRHFRDFPLILAGRLLRGVFDEDERFACVSNDSITDVFETMVTDEVLTKVKELIVAYEDVHSETRAESDHGSFFVRA